MNAHVPHSSELLTSLAGLKVLVRALDTETRGRNNIVGQVSELENHIHMTLDAIDKFKQELLDDYATTIFQREQYSGSDNPFVDMT